MDKPKNSKAKIAANNRYKNKTYKRISADLKPEEADYIRKVAKNHGISIAQLLIKSVQLFDESIE